MNRDPARGVRPAPIGAYRRAVRIVAEGPVVTAEMEDDAHQFEFRLEHANGIITHISGSILRAPWSLCPGAVGHMEALKGEKLADIQVLPAVSRYEHCLHLFDLALLAAAHAGKSGFTRHYRVEGDFDRDPRLMTLWRDGAQMLSWGIDGGTIKGSAFDGLALKDVGRDPGARTADETEAVMILRRASMIALVRTVDLDAFERATEVKSKAIVSCYVEQPIRRDVAVRWRGTARDFHKAGTWPLG